MTARSLSLNSFARQSMMQGKIYSVSSYVPLDLFDSRSDVQASALLALLDSPQNNFKVWRNGDILVPPPSSGMCSLIDGEANLTWQVLMDVLLVRDRTYILSYL